MRFLDKKYIERDLDLCKRLATLPHSGDKPAGQLVPGGLENLTLWGKVLARYKLGGIMADMQRDMVRAADEATESPQ